VASNIKGGLVKEVKVIYLEPANMNLFSLVGLIIAAFLVLPVFGVGLIAWLVLHILKPKERATEIILAAIATMIVVATGTLNDLPWQYWPLIPLACYACIDIWLWLSRKYIESAEKTSWQERSLND
jgi:hypothetical protein